MQQRVAVARAVLAASVQLNRYASGTGTWEEIMELGNFSVSLAAKDIQASKLFYEKLGFYSFCRRSIAELADYEEWRIGKLLPGAFSPRRYVPQAGQNR